jgi:hypothetical protein
MTIDGVLGLTAARKRAKGLLGAVANDRDPLRERRKSAELQENTLRSIAEEYLTREGKKLRQIGVNDKRERIQACRFSHFRESFVIPMQ